MSGNPRQHDPADLEHANLGATARSIMSCPQGFEVVADGVPLHDREDEPFFVVDLVPTRVMLLGPSQGEPMTMAHRRAEVEVPLDDFRSRRHELNAGYLQRAAEHANACHQGDLRRTVAQSLGRDIEEIGGVEIHHIDVGCVSVDWLDDSGATRLILRFGRPARTPDELAGLLIEQLRLIGVTASRRAG